jgi:hypothetical protein
MKQFGFTLMLFVIVLSPLAAVCQGGAQASAPGQNTGAASPAISQAGWQRIQKIPRGHFIVVTSTYGPALECQFAGATDAELYCDEPDSPATTGYVFERSRVVGVKAVKPHDPDAPRIRNPHWGRWVTEAVAGTLVGVGVAKSGGTAAGVGMGAATALIIEGAARGVPIAPYPYPYPYR